MEFELESRRRIYELIRDSPGVHLRELERRLDLVVGSLQYHLQFLEKNNLISQFKDEEYVRYFVKERALSRNEREILYFLRRKGCRHILMNLLRDTDMNNKELSAAVGLSPSTVSWNLSKLVKAGMIEKDRAGRTSNFTIVDPDLVAELLIYYKESFLDSILDNFIEMWEFGESKSSLKRPNTAKK